MKPAARTYYHSTLWPAVCAAQGWDRKDQDLRRSVTLDAMRAVGAPEITSSDPAWKDAHSTALFTYLRHLAEPDNLSLLQRWTDCQAGYEAFNMSRQADHFQQIAYGRTLGERITGRRFFGRRKAEQPAMDPDAPLTKKEAADRLMTMRARARKKTREYKLEATPREFIPRELCPF